MHVMATFVTVTQKTIPWVPEVFSHVQLFSSHLIFRQSWTKFFRHFYISGAFSSSHKSNPSPHPTNNIGCTISKTHASGFIRGSKHQETDESTRSQDEYFYCFQVFGTRDETRCTSFWYDFSNETKKKYAVIHFFAIVLPKWNNNNLKHCVNMHD